MTGRERTDRPSEAVAPGPVDDDRARREQQAAAAEPEWKRRQRLARIFGDVLPERTRDERDPGEGRDRGESAGDAWLKSQVPPHHGG